MNKQKILLTVYKQYLNAKPLLFGALVVIVFGFLGALFVRIRSEVSDLDGTPANSDGQTTEIGDDIKKIGRNEPVKGEKNARYVLIEYSDYECPYCKDFHASLSKFISENKDFKWVYRHFPLAQLHAGATDKAISASCVLEEAGNDKFWEFSDALFENQALAVSDLTNLAKKVGVDEKDYNKCVKDFDKTSLADVYDKASKIGIGGTPSTIILDTKTNNSTLVVGGLPTDEILAKAKALN